jgi:hypothetical protein
MDLCHVISPRKTCQISNMLLAGEMLIKVKREEVRAKRVADKKKM